MKHKIWLLILTFYVGFFVPDFYAQAHFTCTMINDSLTEPNVYEFDIYMASNANEWVLQNVEKENDAYKKVFRKEELENFLKNNKVKVNIL